MEKTIFGGRDIEYHEYSKYASVMGLLARRGRANLVLGGEDYPYAVCHMERVTFAAHHFSFQGVDETHVSLVGSAGNDIEGVEKIIREEAAKLESERDTALRSAIIVRLSAPRQPR